MPATSWASRNNRCPRINTQISNEQLNLQSAMSTDYDTDMASAVSDYTSAQIAYQATLETTASMLKMTLLNYL